jgi:hypothetical protein
MHVFSVCCDKVSLRRTRANVGPTKAQVCTTSACHTMHRRSQRQGRGGGSRSSSSVAVVCPSTRINCEWQRPCKTSSSHLIHLGSPELPEHAPMMGQASLAAINSSPCFHVHAMHALSAPQPTRLQPALREGCAQQQLRHACPESPPLHFGPIVPCASASASHLISPASMAHPQVAP